MYQSYRDLVSVQRKNKYIHTHTSVCYVVTDYRKGRSFTAATVCSPCITILGRLKSVANKRGSCFSDQLNAQFFYSIIVRIYYIITLIMFQATSRSSSGGQIVLLQHLVSSLSVRLLIENDDTRCCDNTIWPPDDKRDVARNMLRVIM
jgi:hypothetical protein